MSELATLAERVGLPVAILLVGIVIMGRWVVRRLDADAAERRALAAKNEKLHERLEDYAGTYARENASTREVLREVNITNQRRIGERRRSQR